MKAVLALVLVALLVVCAQTRRAAPGVGRGFAGLARPRWSFNKKAVIANAEDDDDEESDFWMALAPLAVNLIKNKLSKKRDAVDEDDEEADAEFFKNLLKKVGGIALQAGKAYVGSKYGIQLDEEEEADFINWKKIGEVAKNVGKSYLSSKYGINLDEEVKESDAEFLGKLGEWWKNKGQNLFQKGLQIYSAIKGNKAAPAAEAPAEGDAVEESDSFGPAPFPSIGAPSTYDYADHDSKGPSVGATVFKSWLIKYFPAGKFGGIYNYRPVRGGSSLSLHAEGRAIDWMLNAHNAAQKAVGDALFAYLQKNGKNMGVQEAIWNRQIWSARGLRAYTGENPHTDHVHVGLNRWAAKNFKGN